MYSQIKSEKKDLLKIGRLMGPSHRSGTKIQQAAGVDISHFEFDCNSNISASQITPQRANIQSFGGGILQHQPDMHFDANDIKPTISLTASPNVGQSPIFDESTGLQNLN